jgi:hypothetical protein
MDRAELAQGVGRSGQRGDSEAAGPSECAAVELLQLG